MTDIKALEKRLETLETQVAYQDQTIEDLNKAITEQWTLLDRFKKKIARLEEELDEIEAAAGNPVRVDKPPHY